MKYALRITLISFLILFFIPRLTVAETKTFIKEYTYQASEYDSKVTCRTLALAQVKRLLLEELGTYLESNKDQKQSEDFEERIKKQDEALKEIDKLKSEMALTERGGK